MQFLIDHAPAWTLPYIYQLTEREWSLVFDALIAIVAFGLLLTIALVARRHRRQSDTPPAPAMAAGTVGGKEAPTPMSIAGGKTVAG